MNDPDEGRTPETEMPFNPLPAMVIVLAVVLGGIEIILQAAGAGYLGGEAGVGWRIAAIEDWGFNGFFLDQMLERGIWQWEVLIRFFSYAFIHGNATHAIFAVVFLLALGKIVAETFGNIAVLLVFLIGTAAGALGYYIFTGAEIWLIGGLPGVYGLIGAYTFILWLGLGALHQRQIRAFTLIGFLMAAQLLFGLLFGGSPDWIADICGFAAGFLISFLIVPGGIQRMISVLRRRG